VKRSKNLQTEHGASRGPSAVVELVRYARGQTRHIQTDRHTTSLIAILRGRTRSNNTDLSQYSDRVVLLWALSYMPQGHSCDVRRIL